ncbi:MAG TPA: glycoside hydrolase family 3 N-terminal domain-containing protein [Opitutaceae bacterium]|nr:glycoside hydrolase family 3 N-terminal domain-containing protein [Opitutaceae bacterium]
MLKTATLSFILVGCATVLSAQTKSDSAPAAPWSTGDARLDAKVADLLSQMTLEEKVGQLVQHSSDDHPTGPATKSNILAEIRAGRCGSMLNVTGAAYSKTLQEVAVNESRLHIPLLFGYDVIHGYKTIFPINLGQAASWDLKAIENSERIAATEAAAAGIHWTFSPMVDVARDPRWGRMSEGSGEDTFLGTKIAVARIHGFQGDDPKRDDWVLACAKHFAAYGAAQAGRDYFTTELSERTLREVYLPPFKAAVDAGVATFMAAFNDLNGTPASGNTFLLNTILRREWGFKGFVVSDWGSINELQMHGIASSPRDAVRHAFRAGVDMDMESKMYYPELVTLVHAGDITEDQVAVSAGRILAAKAKLGLLDDPYRYNHPEREKAEEMKPENLLAARDLARRSCVLLQNVNHTLPIKKTQTVALIGPLADSRIDILGSWRARGETSDAVTFKEGFEQVLGAKNVFYAKGCGITEPSVEGFADARSAARKADVIVAVLGEGWEMTGEGHSRTSLDPPGQQLALLTELHELGKPLVVVLTCGRALTLEKVLPLADSVLVAWLPGTMGGPAIADVVTGAYNPSGKLPVTFPRNVGQLPIFYNHKSSGRPQPPGERVQYRSNYIDSPNSPLFPFGYGLSYTQFTYKNLRLSTKRLKQDGSLDVRVTLKNTGSYDGEEVVQLYVRDLIGSVTRPVRELKGFQKVFLKKGESRDIDFTLSPQDLAFYRADMTFGPEPGDFQVFVGGDSDATLHASFALAGSDE